MISAIQSGRHALVFTLLALALAACDKAPAPEPESTPAAEAAPTGQDIETGSAKAAVETGQAKEPGAEAKVDVPKGFDLSSVPLSTATLGDFPYFTLPDGYRESGLSHTMRLDFGQVAMWVGDRFEMVEGKVYASGIRVVSDGGKQFSGLEVARNLEHAVTAAGGVAVFSGEVPREAAKGAEAVMRPYPIEAKCYGHSPAQVFVLRRDDGNVWVRTCTAQNYAGLIVLREQALEPTSSLLPASELKAQLDADGRVAIQVNFAVDMADILPDSQSQIEQVLVLLRDDPGLSLAIEGHTDNTGSAAHNRTLSEARAASVVAALTAQGIEAARLEAAGFGQDRPVADNGSEEGRAKNRRVELVRR